MSTPMKLQGRPIFRRAHYDDLRKSLQDLTDIMPVLQKAETCGIDCQEFRARIDFARQALENIEREFMQPPPTE